METFSFPFLGAENDRDAARIKDKDSGDVISNLVVLTEPHILWVERSPRSVSCFSLVLTDLLWVLGRRRKKAAVGLSQMIE